MLKLLIKNFIISLEDKEDAEHFLRKIESEINEKELSAYCSELREFMESDSYLDQGMQNVSNEFKRQETHDCKDSQGSNENHGE